MQPLGDKVLVLPAEQESEYSSKFIVDDHSIKKPQKGTVVAVGEGRFDEVMTLEAGDAVLFPQHGAVEIEVDKVKHLLMPQSNCWAKWKK